MLELIDRLQTIQQIKNTFCSECDCEYGDASCKVCEYDFCIGILNEQPTIEPKRGEWIEDHQRFGKKYHCSVCKKPFYVGIGISFDVKRFRFCPNCGADMRTPTEVQLDEADSVMMGGADNGFD